MSVASALRWAAFAFAVAAAEPSWAFAGLVAVRGCLLAVAAVIQIGVSAAAVEEEVVGRRRSCCVEPGPVAAAVVACAASASPGSPFAVPAGWFVAIGVEVSYWQTAAVSAAVAVAAEQTPM